MYYGTFRNSRHRRSRKRRSERESKGNRRGLRKNRKRQRKRLWKKKGKRKGNKDAANRKGKGAEPVEESEQSDCVVESTSEMMKKMCGG